jgi:hypothetical protein
MADTFSTTSLRTAFRYPFHSPEGLSRFLVGVALLFLSLFVPILPVIFVYGYLMQVMRRIIQGEAPALPEWKDWGRLGLDGLRSLVAAVVYLGPGLVIMAGGWLLYMLMYLGGMTLITNTRHAPSAIAIMLVLGAVGILFLSLFASLCLLLIGGVPLPAALAHMAARERLSAAFNVFEWGGILTADRWGYFISWVITVGLATLLQIVFALMYFTVVLCAVAYVILLPAGFYLSLVAAAVFAQAYREGAARQKADAPARAVMPVQPADPEPAQASETPGMPVPAKD